MDPKVLIIFLLIMLILTELFSFLGELIAYLLTIGISFKIILAGILFVTLIIKLFIRIKRH